MSDLHICSGTNKGYIPRVRNRGQRRWTLLGKRKRSANAVKAMAESMLNGSWDFGDVIVVSDYYDPITIFEAKRL